MKDERHFGWLCNKDQIVIICIAFIVLVFFAVFMLRQNRILHNEMNAMRNEMKEQKLSMESRFSVMEEKILNNAKSEEESQNLIKEKEKEFELLHPMGNEKDTLIYESFFKDLKKGMRLRIKLEENIKSDYFRVYLSEDNATMRLCFLNENGYFKPLYEFEAITYSEFNERYSEVKPEIVGDKDGFYLTEKLLNLEVGDDADDVMASKMIEYFSRKEDNLTVDFIF